MNAMMSRVRRFLISDDGPTAVEYVVMLSLIIAVCVGVVRALGESTLGSFGAFGAALSASGS
jgi:pilus assembly protein Flp/PilA